ncbi:DUF2933 domain-containing protein [Pollutimonas sp. H1-120]|uniref:DUF2933 domain-containing protein n=1 Tax=Pollutimonas sp. H1-120 TaxID=3148824 RepID=UPI003B52FFF1
MKTMIKVGFGLGTLLAIAYFTLPAARELISAAAPFLLFLICPLSMMFMMKGMTSCSKENDVKAEKIKDTPPVGNVKLDG